MVFKKYIQFGKYLEKSIFFLLPNINAFQLLETFLKKMFTPLQTGKSQLTTKIYNKL